MTTTVIAPESARVTTEAHERRPALSVRGLRVRYGSREVLSGIDLRVAPGEIVGLIGESGSGKTSLARAVLGLVPVAAGSVEVDGQDVSTFTRGRWQSFRRSGSAQYVFQDPLSSLDSRFTVRASVLEGLRETLPRTEAEDRAARALRTVGLAETLWDRRPGQLSGGQRQRVAIARATAVSPKLLICDEPVSALDASSRIEVVRTLETIARAGTGVLIISHDLSSLGAIADRVSVLNEAQIVESGPAAEVLGSPRHPYTRRLIDAIPTI
ncbi:ABC transporter ATP-binding protein [Brevibacterium jeotgali]|uniref:ABC-type dipeptide/oligopeptide/nickel transport system, ATPase component n=1 Tax=Brevibacterium jeotgali TaxID=1262550 RepID=A0A2H1L3S7_9MICO|nr:ABC transporter ATP-binding protein [Brevibacterium jeotgali]TWC01695.1 ABC-type dipeptide/oligopeptide/nickel transport system ATPase component [Brevibacterium jeotgali]SMY11440.1 ABC-type dipeptide/oligopeptide/nickel transport system, ATPase component [Brevibacterium jeotgali]